ncbi:MAG: Ig-like domain-containing protein [Gemmatimonadaceae bacterium]
MYRQTLMLAVGAAVLATAACSKKDINGITGTTDYTSIQLGSDPTSFDVVLHDSAAFTPTAKIEPQDVAISNAIDNMNFSFADPDVAEVNGSGYVQGDAVGTTTLTITYIDVNHDFAATTLVVPVTVTAAPPPRIVH